MSTNTQVAHLWANGQAGKGSNFHSPDGRVLYSYNTVIAITIEGVHFISSDNMTPTTAKQLSYARRAVGYSNYFSTPAFRYGNGYPPTAEECIKAAAEDMKLQFAVLCRKRQGINDAIERYETRRQEIIDIAARFNIEIGYIPEATGDLKATAALLAERETAERQEAERKEAERKEAARKEAKKQYLQWVRKGTGAFPSAYYVRGADMLSIKGTDVITSQGAECPLDHVIKALAFYDSRRQDDGTFKPYQTNGHKVPLGHFTLDSIDETGNVKAGCHNFSAREIVRFREQWKI